MLLNRIPLSIPSQMFARHILQRTAPIITFKLALEDAEAGRDLIWVDDQTPPTTSHTTSHAKQLETSAGTSAAQGVNPPDKPRSRKPAALAAASMQGHWRPKRLEDVEEKTMLDDLVSCDICKTSIANLHR